ncbi:MAG TPA: hypothetical protein VHG09_00335 [Longimicrobiales bacterium]|nr:hypothetical protein [Longimicrobiales bacterium]
MGIFRPSRRRDEDGVRTVNHRMTIFAIGAIVGVAGIASGTSWIIYIAVGILAVGIILRVAQRRE